MQDSQWKNLEVKADMNDLLAVRTEVNSLLEQARNDKYVAVCPVYDLSLTRALFTDASAALRKPFSS